jgi:hypothetical protein
MNFLVPVSGDRLAIVQGRSSNSLVRRALSAFSLAGGLPRFTPVLEGDRGRSSDRSNFALRDDGGGEGRLLAATGVIAERCDHLLVGVYLARVLPGRCDRRRDTAASSINDRRGDGEVSDIARRAAAEPQGGDMDEESGGADGQ